MNNEQQITEYMRKLRAITLSENVAQDMRARLAAYADMHAVSIPQKSIRSPYSFVAFSRIALTGAFILIILVTGTGVTFASQNTLPGEPLYAVKVNVAEPLQTALIPTHQGKAAWENVLAERRLTEAATLAAQNKLATSTQTYLEEQTAVHIARSEAESDSLEESGQADQALAIRSDLEARLSAHAKLLALIKPRLDAAGDATSSAKVAILLANVSRSQTEASISREATEVALSSTASSDDVPAPQTVAMKTTMPTRTAVVAFVESQNTARHKEEADLLERHASILSLVAPATTTQATTTEEVEASTTPIFEATTTTQITTH